MQSPRESPREAKVAVQPAPPPVKEEVPDPDDEFTVTSCCGWRSSCDRELMEFIAKFLVSSAVLAFCMLQLANEQGDSAFLSSTISLILGTYLGSAASMQHREIKRPK